MIHVWGVNSEGTSRPEFSYYVWSDTGLKQLSIEDLKFSTKKSPLKIYAIMFNLNLLKS